MEITEKYRFLKLLNNHRFWAILIVTGLIVQGIGIYFYYFKSFFVLTGILFISTFWWIFNRLCVVVARWLKASTSKILLVGNSFFIALIIAELAIRASGVVANYSEWRTWHYESFYRIKHCNYWVDKNYRAKQMALKNQEFSFERIRNSEGFSDKEWNKAQMAGKYIVLGLGDSFTEGDGTHADSTWLKFLERKINDTGYYYMNAGLCGSDPVFQNYNLQKTLYSYHPDLIILCINSSDISDIIIRGGNERFKDNKVQFRQGPWWEIIYAASHISRLFFSRYYNEYLIPIGDVAEEEKKAIAVIENTVLDMNCYCNNNNLKFLVVFHPFKGQTNSNDNQFSDIIADLENQGVKVADLFGYYENDSIHKDIEEYYWKMDGHHNAKGYHLMAECIYRFLPDKSNSAGQNQ